MQGLCRQQPLGFTASVACSRELRASVRGGMHRPAALPCRSHSGSRRAGLAAPAVLMPAPLCAQTCQTQTLSTVRMPVVEDRVRVGCSSASVRPRRATPGAAGTPKLTPSPRPPQIRFARYGRKKLPFYRIVAIDSKKRRQGAPLEASASRPPALAAGTANPTLRPRRSCRGAPCDASIYRRPAPTPASTVPGLVQPTEQGGQPRRPRHQEVAVPRRRALRDR